MMNKGTDMLSNKARVLLYLASTCIIASLLLWVFLYFDISHLRNLSYTNYNRIVHLGRSISSSILFGLIISLLWLDEIVSGKWRYYVFLLLLLACVAVLLNFYTELKPPSP